jgi:hypothetical protein
VRFQTGCYGPYRDKKVVGVFVRFRAPLHLYTLWETWAYTKFTLAVAEI